MRFYIYANRAPKASHSRDILIVRRFWQERRSEPHRTNDGGMQMFERAVIEVARVSPKNSYTEVSIVSSEGGVEIDDQVVAWAELPTHSEIEYSL